MLDTYIIAGGRGMVERKDKGRRIGLCQEWFFGPGLGVWSRFGLFWDDFLIRRGPLIRLKKLMSGGREPGREVVWGRDGSILASKARSRDRRGIKENPLRVRWGVVPGLRFHKNLDGPMRRFRENRFYEFFVRTSGNKRNPF